MIESSDSARTMAKAELQASRAVYDDLVSKAHEAEGEGRFDDAVRLARLAWHHLEAMLKFERKYEHAEFESVPCIDLVLKYAPLLFDWTALTELGTLLRGRKSIDRIASDDLASRLSEALVVFREAHQVWNELENASVADAAKVSIATAIDPRRRKALIDAWVSMKLVRREGGATRIATDPDERVRAKCPGCGVVVGGLMFDVLSDQECPRCKGRHVFCIL